MSQRILVWDVPTRVFHWLLVVSFAGAFLTAESERYRDIHVVLGYTLLGLIAFRLIWGFVGSRYAQFRSFLFKPGEIAAYVISMLKAKPAHYLGHNPAGSVSVYLLLALGVTVSITGVVVLQDIGGDVLQELHEMVSYAMLTVVALHVFGVLVSSIMHRENLVRSMITGLKSARPNGHARFPHPNPLPQGTPLSNSLPQAGERTNEKGNLESPCEGANESLLESQSGEGIRRAHAWLGVIMLAVVVAFWLGYPATSPTPSNLNVSQAAHAHEDD